MFLATRPGALLVALAALAAGAAPTHAADTRAPDFRTTDVSGNDVRLADLLGKGPIVLDFWATWCKPCIKELPYIQRLHDKYKERGLQVFAVSIDSPKSQSRVKPFLHGRKFTFPVLLDGSQEVYGKLQGKGSVPYVVVLDAEGTFRYRHTGYRPGDENELEHVVLDLLAPAAPDSGSAPAEEPGPAGAAAPDSAKPDSGNGEASTG